MNTKFPPFFASILLILAILACNMPGGQNNAQPDLAATITAQAVALQALSSTPVSANTSLPVDTPQPADTSVPPSAPQPVDTKPAAPAKPKDLKADGSTTAITFSWTDNSVNETGFRLYQSGVTAPITDIGRTCCDWWNVI